MDVLIANAQNAVHMICESISWRVSGLERTRKQAINPELSVPSLALILELTSHCSTDGALFTFLELYMSRLEGPIALQVWNRFLQLTKDVLGTGRDFKPQSYATLRQYALETFNQLVLTYTFLQMSYCLSRQSYPNDGCRR